MINCKNIKKESFQSSCFTVSESFEALVFTALQLLIHCISRNSNFHVTLLPHSHTPFCSFFSAQNENCRVGSGAESHNSTGINISNTHKQTHTPTFPRQTARTVAGENGPREKDRDRLMSAPHSFTAPSWLSLLQEGEESGHIT